MFIKGIEIRGATNATLTLNNVQGLNAGNYSVVAHNSTNLIEWQSVFTTNLGRGSFEFVDPDSPEYPAAFTGLYTIEVLTRIFHTPV